MKHPLFGTSRVVSKIIAFSGGFGRRRLGDLRVSELAAKLAATGFAVID